MLSFVYVTLEMSFSPPSKDAVSTSLDIYVWIYKSGVQGTYRG